MKKKMKHLSKSTLSIILALLMIMSTLVVGLVTFNAANMDIASVGNTYFAYVHFAVPEAWNMAGKTLYLGLIQSGNNKYTRFVSMTRMSTSNLYYYNGSSITDHKANENQVIFVADDTAPTDGNNKCNASYDYTTAIINYELNDSNNYYGFFLDNPATTASTSVAIHGNWNRDLGSASNAGITLKTFTDGTEGYTGGTVGITGNSFNGGNNIKANNVAKVQANSYNYYSPVGMPVTLAATAKEGYIFSGYYDSSDNLLSSDTSYTFNSYVGAGSTTTVKAKFTSETKYDVTVSAGSNGSVQVNDAAHTSGSNINVGSITKAKVEAVPDSGYLFDHWDVTGGVTDSGAVLADDDTTNPLTAVGATAPGTLTANFVEKDRVDIPLTVTAGGKITVSGSTVAGENGDYTSNSEDKIVTAHVGDKVTFTAVRDTSPTVYKLDEFTYTVDGVTNSITESQDITVASGTTYAVDAKFVVDNGYTFTVRTDDHAAATVTITGLILNTDHSPVSVAKGGNLHTFRLASDATFTISSSADSGYTAAVSRVDDHGEHDLSNPVTVGSSDSQNMAAANGSTYFATSATAMGSTDSGFYLHYKTSASEVFGTMSGVVQMKWVSDDNKSAGDPMWADVTLAKDDDVFSVNQKSAWKMDTDHSSWIRAITDTDSLLSSSTADKLGGESNNIHYSYIKPKKAGTYRITVSKDENDTWTADVKLASSAGDVTEFDTYYLGGRFKIVDSDRSVFTGQEEDNWKTFSVKMPFTKVGDTTEYTLNTGLTIRQLSSLIDSKERYFVIHDKKKVYGFSGDGANGNHFENYDSSDSTLTLAEVSSASLSADNELLFNDIESNSDGLVTIHFDSSNKHIWYVPVGETKAVAKSVTLTAKYGESFTNVVPADGIPTNQQIKLEATLVAPDAGRGDVTYTFYDRDGTTKLYSGPNNYCYAFDNLVRTNNYKVEVTCTGHDNVTNKDYRSATGKTTVKFKNGDLYHTDTNLFNMSDDDKKTAILNSANYDGTSFADSTQHTIDLTMGENESHEFILSYSNPITEPNNVNRFYIDESLTKYCDVSSAGYISLDASGEYEAYTVSTYTITTRTACTNPKVYIDSTPFEVTAPNGQVSFYPGKIYAIATYTPVDEQTKHENPAKDKTVTYYFAEAKDIVADSDPNGAVSNAGLAIAYWNNSLDNIQYTTSDNNGHEWADHIIETKNFAAVSTPVNVSSSNKIYVDMTKLYSAVDTSTSKEFYVYSVDLPVWATSFAFLKKDNSPAHGDVIKTKSWNDSEYEYSSLLLNPNRVYLLYKKDSTYYSKGVVLDKGLWSSSTKNTVGTKTFKSNAIEFNTTYSNDYAVNNSFNTNLSTTLYNGVYDTGVDKALYFGYLSEGGSLNNFSLPNNLAMRKDSRSYYASIQGLVADKLDMTNLNSNGFPLLQVYSNSAKSVKKNMPLFDYELLRSYHSKGTDFYKVPAGEDGHLYTGIDFPMYESEFNGVTTYSYDSSTDPNRLISDGNFTVENNYRMAKDYLGYAPFGNSDKNSLYGNATEIDVEFYMSNTGKLKTASGNYQDITFNFSGDDDVWVYVDGVLVLDLGGAHSPSAGSINFSDMMVYYKTAAESSDATLNVDTDTWPSSSDHVLQYDMAAILGAQGVRFNNKDAATKHLFQMFYMERGAYDSNMSVSFNLPQASGLNIKNEVSANDVNDGLRNAAIFASNKDYFSYGVEAKLATNEEVNTVKSVSGYENADSGAATALSPVSTGPNYPYNSDTKRVITASVKSNNTNRTYTAESILSKSNGESAAGAAYTETSSFTKLAGVTYLLSDQYLVANTDAEDPDLDVSGKTLEAANAETGEEIGEFHLMGYQGAQFEDKITPHSLVKVYQKQNMGRVHQNGVNPITFEKVENNNYGNYYVTSYSIFDDHSAKYIKEKTTVPLEHSGSVYAADNSGVANGEAFYFSDYSINDAPTAAMTVTFYNDIAVGDIEITKAPLAGSENVPFYFGLTFANVFGDDFAPSLVEYNEITYRVKDAAGNFDGNTYVYGTTGIKIYPGQTAVISGVPVETNYQVTEKPRAGYKATAMSKTIEGPTGAPLAHATPSHGYTESKTEMQIESTGACTSNTTQVIAEGEDEGTYYVNMIPRICESRVDQQYKTTSKVSFTNAKEDTVVRFHYFDRTVTNGQPANIDSTATVVTKGTSIDSGLTDKTGANDEIKTALQNAIQSASNEFISQHCDNVVDDYVVWTSQADAETGIGSQADIYHPGHNYSERDNYSNNNNNKYHTNHLSQMNTVDANHTNANLWVSYWNAENTYVDGENLTDGNAALLIKYIDVWVFNKPHAYTVNVYGAAGIGDTTEKDVKLNGFDDSSQSVRVAKTATSSKSLSNTLYYNQRIGKSFDSDVSSQSYITQYGISVNNSSVEPRNTLINEFMDGETMYRFSYWAFDSDGKIPASTNAYYYYRVTGDIDLYAVYAPVEMEKTGLSIANNKNDTYYKASGESRTRVNVQLNPYNCVEGTGSVTGDPKIKQTALVTINFNSYVATDDGKPEGEKVYTDEYMMELFDKYRDQLDEILTEHAANRFSLTKHPYSALLGQNPISLTLTTTGYVRNATDGLSSNGMTYSPLTNMNRGQYVVDYPTASFSANKGMMYVGAMYYADTYNKSTNNWIISDNCLIWRNGSCSNAVLNKVV